MNSSFLFINNASANIDVVKSRKDSKECGSVDGDDGKMFKKVAIIHHQDEKDGCHLERSCDLADETGLNFRTVIGEDHDKNAQQDDDIPGDDDDSQPTGKHLDDGESDESCGDEEFVSDRIEMGSQFGALVSNSCNETINSVRNSCHGKDEESPPEGLIDDENDKERNEENSY